MGDLLDHLDEALEQAPKCVAGWYLIVSACPFPTQEGSRALQQAAGEGRLLLRTPARRRPRCRFGVNARALILQAALTTTEGEEEDAGPSTAAAAAAAAQGAGCKRQPSGQDLRSREPCFTRCPSPR